MTREEAINEIKSWDFLEGKEIEAIHTLIPELKESEDERIRKEMVEKITNLACGCFISQEQKQKFIAYLEKQKPSFRQIHDSVMWDSGLGTGIELEKQKEQKPEIYSPLCDTIKDKIREYIVNHFTIDTTVKTDVKSIVKAMEEGVRLGKESQKPAKWNEEDTKMLNSILLHLNVPFHEMNDAEKRMFTWLQEFPERFNLKQKPTWIEDSI